MRLVLQVIGGFIFAVAILAAVLIFRTFSYGSSGQQTAQMNLPDVPVVSGDEIAANLAEALRFRTITLQAGDPRPGTEEPWLDLHDWLETTYPRVHAGMKREIVPGTLTLLYMWEGSDPTLEPILLMAHQDVVPVNLGTEGDWTAPPFAGEIVDGYIYGRGTIDDKGSMVALMEAAEALIGTEFKPKRTIYFLFGHDEEVSGSGAEAGVALLKSRGVTPLMALDEGFMVVDPSPLTGKSMGFIGVAEKGYITVQIVAEGTGGHSSSPPRNSAAVRLARAVAALDDNQMPAHFDDPTVSALFEAAAPDLPFTQRMAFANLWLFRPLVEKEMAKVPPANAMIRTTTAPTMLAGSAKENVLAQRAMAVVNFRIHPSDSEEDVIAHIEDVISEFDGVSLLATQGGLRGAGASPVSPIDNRAYAVLAAVAADVGNGAPVTPALVIGATDGRYATAITDSVYRFVPARMSPEDLTGFHGTNERISVENLERMVRGYAQMMVLLAGE
jgi:carboxypeptidase PM20D1